MPLGWRSPRRRRGTAAGECLPWSFLEARGLSSFTSRTRNDLNHSNLILLLKIVLASPLRAPTLL